MDLNKLIKREIAITISTIIGLLVTFFVLSYAIYMRIDEKDISDVTFGTLGFDMCIDESCALTGIGDIVAEGIYPMTEAEGKARTPYIFRATNSGTNPMYLSVYMAPDSEYNSTEYSHIKVAIKETGGSFIGSIKALSQGPQVLVKNISLAAGTNKTYEVYMWLDESAPNSIIGKDISVFINALGYYKPSDGSNLHTTYVANVSQELTAGKTFGYTGNYQLYEVPLTGYYYIETYGASSNNSYNTYTTSNPVYGGKSSGYIYLSKGDKLYIYVGGQKQTFNCCTAQGTEAGSGGATDIRYFGTTTPSSSDLTWNSTLGLNSRIMVAGGSGGTYRDSTGGIGTSGGGLITDATTHATHPVGKTTQVAGGIAGTSGTAGSFGQGGTNTTSRYNSGGGGYYGGGSGPSGGGGTSFISGYAGVNAITSASSRTHTANTLHYSGKYFIAGEMKVGVNSGNGKAIIKYVGIKEKTNNKLNNVRYIKDCIEGNSSNGYAAWAEIQAIKDGTNIAKNKTVTSTSTVATGYNINEMVDGNIETYINLSVNDYSNQCVTVNLGSSYSLDEIAVWHYFLAANGRSYNNNVTSVSSNGSTWTTIIDKSELETSIGKRVNAY